ncbi:M20/M25/M40 family metallo-hydrolase [Lapidilactobacillus wuchangensis]|uniref:M20/M25/M40 family metallo-hydrolase n=1 Tax=Lapidilactobacillus wuchangensis TaxID=2486001 RepID=UPI000F773436|nr:M20/M25/M40 family metallo-hydrolase [Lapidilactobacillus wuchangensis]
MEKTERLALLDDLIRLATPNGNEKLVADYLEKLFAKHNIPTKHVTYAENRDSLIATVKKSDGPILGFTGHEDVVDPVDASKWTYGPYEPKHVDGKIFGRGTADMKSGLAGQVIAMIELNDDPNFKGNLKLIATVGEEKGEVGSKQLAKEGYVDDVAALIVGEPSNASSDLVMTKMVQGGLVKIPAPLANQAHSRQSFYCAHKGSVTYKVVSHGRAAHSSMPEAGINALANLINFYQKQDEYFGTLSGYSDDILGVTTPAVTIMKAGEQENTIPDYAELTVKVRTIPEYNNDKLIADLEKIIAELNQEPKMSLEFQLSSSNWPVKTAADAKLIQFAHEAYQDVFQQNALAIGAPGGTDASQFIQANPNLEVIVAGPGNESAHQVNEFVIESDYLNYIDIYKGIAKKYFA